MDCRITTAIYCGRTDKRRRRRKKKERKCLIKWGCGNKSVGGRENPSDDVNLCGLRWERAAQQKQKSRLFGFFFLYIYCLVFIVSWSNKRRKLVYSIFGVVFISAHFSFMIFFLLFPSLLFILPAIQPRCCFRCQQTRLSNFIQLIWLANNFGLWRGKKQQQQQKSPTRSSS